MKAYFDLLERCAMTFIQSFAALLVADTAGIDLSVSTTQAAAVAGIASVLAVLKGFAAQRLVGDASPSLVK
jgi:ribose/xylose/arabinose/galactoside ABC-type transport system permease subunit